MTTSQTSRTCACCGYPAAPDRCAICGGAAREIGHRRDLRVGRRAAALDLLRGIDDVRRAVFALLYEREFIGLLRLPVAMNALAVGAAALLGALVFEPAFVEIAAAEPGATGLATPHRWLIAAWLTIGPPLLEAVAGWAQTPLRRAAEKHMLGATVAREQATPTLFDRLQVLMVCLLAMPVAMAATMIPYAGFPIAAVVGAAVAAVVWLQRPLAARGLPLRLRLRVLQRNPWRALGTGLGLQLAAGVPFVNLLALAPIAAIASTSAYLHFDKAPTPPAVTPAA